MSPLTRLISKIKGNRRKLVRSKDVFPLTGVAGEAAKCNQQLPHCLLSLQIPGGRRLHSPLHSKSQVVYVPETFAQQLWSILTEALPRDQEGAEVFFRNHILGTGKRVSGQGAYC